MVCGQGNGDLDPDLNLDQFSTESSLRIISIGGLFSGRHDTTARGN